MRQVCPQCQKLVDVPEGAREVVCPGCQSTVTVPETYAVVVDPLAVKPTIPMPPPVVPPPVTSAPIIPPQSVTQTQSIPGDPNRPAPPPGYALPTSAILPPSAGYTNSFAVGLSPVIVPWVMAVGFVLILLLTPFPWVGAYPAGSTAYSQSFWGALSNGFSSSIPFEQELKQELNLKNAVRSDWWILLPYLLIVVVGAVLAMANQLIHASDFAFRIGPLGTVRALVWPRRAMILGGLSVAALLLFSLESLRGFGLQAAVRTVANAKYGDELAATDNSADRERVRARIAVEQARLGEDHGTAWWLVGLSHLAIVGAAGLHLWLDNRGNAPPPRVVAEW